MIPEQAKMMISNHFTKTPWDALTEAIKALDKQIPKKIVYKDRDGHKGIYEKCPMCFEIVECGFNYCCNCGQALEW